MVCDKDGVVDWCIVLVEMLLTRFEECWPLPTESLPELPWNLNIVTLTLTLWPINSGVLTFLLLLNLSSSLTDSLPSLNLLYHSITDALFMQDGRKAVWSIPYVSVLFFPSLKQNFIAYRSSKVSSLADCIFEIHQLWQSGFSRVYSNCCCSCSFEPEISHLIRFLVALDYGHQLFLLIYISKEREREEEEEEEAEISLTLDDITLEKYTRVIQKLLSINKLKTFCGKILTLLLKQEKLIHISVLISVQVKPVKRWEGNDESKKKLRPQCL